MSDGLRDVIELSSTRAKLKELYDNEKLDGVVSVTVAFTTDKNSPETMLEASGVIVEDGLGIVYLAALTQFFKDVAPYKVKAGNG